METTSQMNGKTPSFEALNAALQRNNQRIRSLEEENRALKHQLRWEDELFAHTELSPAQKLVARSLYPQLSSGTQGSQPIAIWRIAKETGQSNKTAGKTLQFFDANNILKRNEQHDRVTQKTQISIEVPEPLKHPNLIQLAAPRNHGGHRDPKPKCPACGGDLEIETAVQCPVCGMKHTVNVRPATEHDTPLTEKFTELARIDRQLTQESARQDDRRSPFEPDEATTVEGSIEPPHRAAVILTGAPEETEEKAAEESSGNYPYILQEEKCSNAPPVFPNTPPAQNVLQEAASTLLEIAGPGPKPEHVEMSRTGSAKYFTVHRRLTLEDALNHLRGKCTKGATLQHPGGLARAICFDADNLQDWQRLEEAAVLLASLGFKPILEPSPVQDGDHVGGGHLWIIFESLVDAYAVHRTLYYRAPVLSEIKERWPNAETEDSNTRVRLPGGKYVRPGFEAWCCLYDAYKNELSHDGPGAAWVLLQYQSPIDLLVIVQKPIPQKALPPAYKPSAEERRGLSLVKQIIDDFNATYSWEEIASRCGGFNRQKKFAAIWRGDRTPNVSVDPQTDLAKDFSTNAWLPYPMDKYQVWCLIEGDLNWEEFKRRDLAQRCKALEDQVAPPKQVAVAQVREHAPTASSNAAATVNSSELEALADELGAEICDPCTQCGCPLYWDHQGELWCCRCLPKPRAGWSEDAWRRLRALPRKVQACLSDRQV